MLASGASFEFDYNPDGDLVLNAGETHINAVTVTGVDDEGTEDTAQRRSHHHRHGLLRR